ncbi:hypothetical protein N431DRAFT_136549 [Stipitochalara longipes BDJ]|nr:hypothetical protein N431DRAFT_136549 [Stipitochalara longipes BDJ]
MYQLLISVLALAACVNGVPHIIDVGKQGSLSFSPNSLSADVGDTLEFHFYSGSGGHSVVSSTLEKPCVPDGTFFSGYQAADTTGDTTFVVNVTSLDPIWFYCSLGSHCQAGMSGVVNPPAGVTITNYTDNAGQVQHASAPASLTGGTVTSINEATETTQPGGPLHSATTTPGSSTTGAQATPTTSTSTGATPSPTKSESRRGNDLSVVLGLSVVVGGLVVLMA